MEGLIPVLVALAYFILQAYTGYQKEKEKAAKRQIGKPVPPEQESTMNPTVERPVARKPLPPSAKQPTSTPEPVYTDYEEQSRGYEPQAEPSKEQSYKPYKQEQYVPDVPPNLLEEYRKLSEYAEFERLKAKKKGTVLKQQSYSRTIRPKLEQLETQEIDDLNFQEYEIDFDVREAILAKAILDRPHS